MIVGDNNLIIGYDVTVDEAAPGDERLSVHIVGHVCEERLDLPRALGLRGAVQIAMQTALDRAAASLEGDRYLPRLLTVTVAIGGRWGARPLIELVRADEDSTGA